MPAGVVKTKAEEIQWNRAKAAVDSRLGKGTMTKVAKGSTRYWKLVMFLYKRFIGEDTKK